MKFSNRLSLSLRMSALLSLLSTLVLGSPSLEMNAGPQSNFGGFGGNAAARFWFETRTALQLSVGVQATETRASRSGAFSRAVIPVLVGLRYSLNRGSSAAVQPHLNVGMGPYFVLSAQSSSSDASASGLVNWGVRPGTGFDLNLGSDLFAAVNVGYHFVAKYEGLETTLGLGAFF
jgi:hypothetical protein